MKSLTNRVNLIGTLGKDVTVTSFESGTKKASFSIATNERYKNDKGERVDNTQWHNIIAWGKLAELCESHLKKGKKVALQGRLETRQYNDNEGNKKFYTEIILQDVLFLSPKED